MAITLQTQLSLFPNMPVQKYKDEFGFGIGVFKFTLDKIHHDDEVIVIPHFTDKIFINKFHGKVEIEGNNIYIHVSIIDVAMVNFYDVYIKKTSEESIRLFKEGENKKNASIDELD